MTLNVGDYDRWRIYYVHFMELRDLHRLTAVVKVVKCRVLRFSYFEEKRYK
jgi:hypothetical protein